MAKLFIQIGAISGAFAVALGAFGAHGLSKMLEETGRTDTFETAVKYHFYHTFALIILGIIISQYEHNLLNISGYLFISGIIIFSGSLYILCLTNTGWLGAITPIGGLLLIAAWILMVIGIGKTAI